MTTNKQYAAWSISLDTTCPECLHEFDVLDDPDFWGNSSIDPLEHDTPNTIGVEIVCPECRHEFIVDFQY